MADAQAAAVATVQAAIRGSLVRKTCGQGAAAAATSSTVAVAVRVARSHDDQAQRRAILGAAHGPVSYTHLTLPTKA